MAEGSVLIKNRGRGGGGFPRRRRGRGKGAGECLWGGGGGLNIFFRARKSHQDYDDSKYSELLRRSVFLLRPPNLVRHGPFFERKNVCNSQENGVRTRRAAIVNHPAVLKIVRVVNLLRVLFLVRRGPLGWRSSSSLM